MTILSDDSTWCAWAERAPEPDLVSVVIPTYDRARLLERALSSVSAQSWRPIEIVICDDGSSDDTQAVVERWVAQAQTADIRVRYVRQANAGVSAARTRGLVESRGAWIQYLDSDDELLPDKFERQIRLMRLEGTQFCNSRTRTSGPSGAHEREVGRALPRLLKGGDYADYFWTVMGPLYRREVCAAVGPWPSVHPSEDLVYEARVKGLGVPHSDISESLSVWHQHEGERSGDNRLRSARASARVARLLREELVRLGVCDRSARTRLVRYYVRAATVAHAEGERREALAFLSEARPLARGADRLVVGAARVGVSVLPGRILDRLAHCAARCSAKTDPAGS